jgi:hypothetical protein
MGPLQDYVNTPVIGLVSSDKPVKIDPDDLVHMGLLIYKNEDSVI